MILRRGFVLGKLVAILILSVSASALDDITLDGPRYSVTVDAVHGRLLRFAEKAGTWELNTPLDLAGNFLLVIQQVNGTQAVVLGAQQRFDQSKLNGNTLELVWDGPLTDTQGATHDMAVHLTVDAEGDAVTFKSRVENRSPDMLAEISCPILGGLEDFSTPGQEAQCALYPPPARKTLERPFGNYATAYPGGLNMGFMDINNAAVNRGLYIGLHDTVARHKQFRFAESGQGDAATISFSAVHFPHIRAGGTFEGSPVVLRLHEGDWRAGSLFYRDWFIHTFGLMDPSRDWIRRESFFQMIMMMLPEGNINYTFKDVPQLAKDGLKYGVRSLQLAGWQRGGHDNGYPYYEPDPRLGTWNDVAEAIEKCHKMGVKVYFFVNFQPVMMDLKWYREELGNYAALNGHGAIQWIAGWGMGTLASRMGDTVPLMAFADVSYPGMSDTLTGYFRKLAEAGADGLHVDKMFPAALDFNPRLTMGPDTSPWEGAVQLMARIDRECRAVNDDFRMSFECNWDRILQFSSATWWAGNMTTAKLAFPEVAETVGHYMPYDFLAINHDVRLGHAVMIAPYKFNRSMDVKPWRRMARYIGEVKSIRDQLTDIIYLGEVLPQQQVLLPPEGLPGGVQCALWRSLKDGRRACIITNDGMTAVEQKLLGMEGNTNGDIDIYTPFEEKRQAIFPVTVTIPAEGIIFVAETPVTFPPLTVYGTLASAEEAKPPFENANFETGDLSGWTADANWRVDNNAAGGWYSGWHGRWYAWSGEGGEQATGRLRSPLFALAKEGVEVWVAGWADIQGQTANRWNYVALHLADGTELDRRYAPNSVTFTPLVLTGSGHVGEQVYIEAMDDAPEGSYSMICIDQIALVDVEDALTMPLARARRVHVLENEHYRVEVDRRHGTIRRILDKAKNLELIREPRLAGNFEFSLPIKKEEAWQNTEANYILGGEQRLDSCTRHENGLTLTWDGPLRSVFGEEYDATVTMRIDLVADDVVFNLSIDNRSALEVGEVYYPILGGLRGLGETQQDLKDTYLALPYGAGLKTSRPFYVFDNMVPFGSLYPEQYHRYPDALSMPWLDLYNARLQRGVYIGSHDPIARNKTFQLLHIPGTASVRMDGNWPRPEELDGQPTGVRLCMVQVAYQPAGQTFEASPVVLRFHDGDWRGGAAAYRDWFTREIGTAANRGDAAGFRPVGRIPYAQLPEHAKAALEKGLKVLLLTDWKSGGQNDGVPRLELDPSLGTPDDLKYAIAQCHQLGVRVVFLFNVQHANPASDWYQQELHQYITIDRWGVPATWGERRWHFISPAFPELQHLWAGQVRTLAELGADGIHLRDFFPPAMDFNPGLTSTPDRSSWEGALTCIRQMANEGSGENPDFRVSTNLVRDRLMIDAPFSEMEVPETSAFREVFPQWRVFKP